MTRPRTPEMKWSALGLRLALGVTALHVVHAAAPRLAYAQTEQELDAARKLFTEAYKEEQAGHFEGALSKYQRVQRVKDTANVRFRIGICLEQLGKSASALRAYEGAIEVAGSDKANADVARTAGEHAQKLAPSVPHLTLVSENPDSKITVDGAPIDAEHRKSPIPLDPGTHTVIAERPGSAPFQTTVELGTGSRVSLTIPSAPAPANKATTDEPPPVTPTPTQPESSARTLGIVTTGAGVLLLGGAAVFLVMRQSDIRELESSCPNGVCPSARRSELTSTRERALWEGPVAAGLGAAGVIATGVGIYFLVHPPSSSPKTAQIVPLLDPTSTTAGIQMRGAF